MSVLASLTAPETLEDRTSAMIDRIGILTTRPLWGCLRLTIPTPSAAFSRRDSRMSGFGVAVKAMRQRGFEPFIRPIGGRLAAYDEAWLVIDIVGRSPNPRLGTTGRFRVFADAIAAGIRDLGVDARVGRVPGEYCPGEWSVNAGGRVKLAGTGQRITREGFLVSAVIAVGDPNPAREAMAAGYRALTLPLDEHTVGSICREGAGLRPMDAVNALMGSLESVISLGGSDGYGNRPLLRGWEPR